MIIKAKNDIIYYFIGPSEKFRGWGKPIQSAKYRN